MKPTFIALYLIYFISRIMVNSKISKFHKLHFDIICNYNNFIFTTLFIYLRNMNKDYKTMQ